MLCWHWLELYITKMMDIWLIGILVFCHDLEHVRLLIVYNEDDADMQYA